MSKHPPKKFRKAGRNKVKTLKPQTHRTLAVEINPKEKIILDTLRYRQIFGCPMNFFQIWNYLLISDKTNGLSKTQANGLTPIEFKQTLTQLVKSGAVLQKGILYSLKKVDYQKYGQNQSRAKELVIKAQGITKYLKRIPWIEMIALTGGVAAFNADKDADIDMLIVTKPRRLFISRLFLVIILKILGVYWNPKDPAGKICPNILLASDNMAWETKNQNLYVANEISLLYPLYYREDCYFKFLAVNEWFSTYLPNYAAHITIVPSQNAEKKYRTGVLTDVIELVARKFQLMHMRKKITTENVKKDFLHFNTNDKTPYVLGFFGKPLDN